MSDLLKWTTHLLNQPYQVIALICGVLLVAFPCITINKDYQWMVTTPSTIIPVALGIVLLFVSIISYGYSIYQKYHSGSDIEFLSIKEDGDTLWTMVGDCEIRVVYGRIEEQRTTDHSVIVLPCNEYFDDKCARDSRSALGSYVARTFDGQAENFISLTKEECKRKLGSGTTRQKTEVEQADSFGAGKCVLLIKPLGSPVPIALVSTSTQRAGEGLAGQFSYLFDGMQELATRLADARLNEVIMPILGAGHAGISPSLALGGLLLAIAETARKRRGLKRVTVVVFRENLNSPVQVERKKVRQALMFIGS